MKFKGTKGDIKKYIRHGSLEVFSGKDPVLKEKRIAEMHHGNSLINPTFEEAEFNADLLVDALITIQKCDLMPSQLFEQRDELLSFVQRITQGDIEASSLKVEALNLMSKVIYEKSNI